MLIYYSNVAGKENVRCETPIQVGPEFLLNVFRGITPRIGFVGFQISEGLWIQVSREKTFFTIEILDHSAHTVEIAKGSPNEIEGVLQLCGGSLDIRELVRRTFNNWKRIELPGGAAVLGSTADEAPLSAPDGLITKLPLLKIESIHFDATEAGFVNGVTGASNSKSNEPYHYLLFGPQADPQHPENSGMYLEYDHQSNGRVDIVKEALIGKDKVAFHLKNNTIIEVGCGTDSAGWESFLESVRQSFLTQEHRGENEQSV